MDRKHKNKVTYNRRGKRQCMWRNRKGTGQKLELSAYKMYIDLIWNFEHIQSKIGFL